MSKAYTRFQTKPAPKPYPTPTPPPPPPPPYIISGTLGITPAVEKLVHALSTFFLFGLLLKHLDKLQYGLNAAARNSGKIKKNQPIPNSNIA